MRLIGVDFAAPIGTPVMATGGGTVLATGRNPANGNYVKMRHTNAFMTYYLHLCRFGKGRRSRARVRQGQVIGYVGMTGYATGPHLDYRVKRGTPSSTRGRFRFPPGAAGHEREHGLVHRSARQAPRPRLANVSVGDAAANVASAALPGRGRERRSGRQVLLFRLPLEKMTAKRIILVHACCASCSSYVLAHLAETFEVTAYFFNPNIHPDEEYALRLAEMRSVCGRLALRFVEGDFSKDRWWKEILPFRELPRKSERCWTCYRFRLEETARKAAELAIPLFTTTLSVSPHKAYERIAVFGGEAAARHGIEFSRGGFQEEGRIQDQRRAEPRGPHTAGLLRLSHEPGGDAHAA